MSWVVYKLNSFLLTKDFMTWGLHVVLNVYAIELRFKKHLFFFVKSFIESGTNLPP